MIPTGGLPRLLEIMRRLRDPETGCPWDIEQDFATIAPYTIEEAYEVADAIERQDWAELEGELGDLLLQTVYHTQMGEEAGLFHFRQRCQRDVRQDGRPPPACVRRRNPATNRRPADPRLGKDQGRRTCRASAEGGALDGVAVGLPALMRAVKLQKRAARVGFDWPSTRSGPRQDRRRGARTGRGPRQPVARRDDRGIRRSAVRHRQSRAPPEDRPRRRPARRQCQIHPPVSGRRGPAAGQRANAPNSPIWQRWTRCGTR